MHPIRRSQSHNPSSTRRLGMSSWDWHCNLWKMFPLVRVREAKMLKAYQFRLCGRSFSRKPLCATLACVKHLRLEDPLKWLSHPGMKGSVANLQDLSSYSFMDHIQAWKGVWQISRISCISASHLSWSYHDLRLVTGDWYAGRSPANCADLTLSVGVQNMAVSKISVAISGT